MAGIIVHTIALNQVLTKIKNKLGRDLLGGDKIGIMDAYKAILPDIEKEHAYWLPTQSIGNFESMVQKYIPDIESRSGGRFNDAIYRVTHYIVDCHSIGHFLGSKMAEYICEPLGEFVTKKDSYPNTIILSNLENISQWFETFYESVSYSHDKYGKNYIFNIAGSVRRSIMAARQLTTELVRLYI